MSWKRVAVKLLSGQKGFTLLEVLIAIFVLSIGLLGLAALQLNAQQNAHYSYQSTIANLAAKDVKERLWRALIEDADRICPSGDGVDDIVSIAEDVWAGKGGEPEKLPGMSIDIESLLFCEYVVTIGWRNDRAGVELIDENPGRVTSFNYYVRLPGLPDPP